MAATFTDENVGAAVAECPLQQKPQDWIEIRLVGEDSAGIAWAKYRVTLPDGKLTEGYLDKDGFARLTQLPTGTCKICFPELDGEAWEYLQSEGGRAAA